MSDNNTSIPDIDLPQNSPRNFDEPGTLQPLPLPGSENTRRDEHGGE